jgi:hypothetical protein
VLQKPTTLDEAVMYARAYAQRDTSRALPPPPVRRSTPQAYGHKPATPTASGQSMGQASSIASVNGPTLTIKRLMLAEIAQRRKDGKCFHCDDLFSNGHRFVRKQLFVIEVIATDELEQTTDAMDPTISLHMLTDIHPRSGKTMQLLVVVIGEQHLASRVARHRLHAQFHRLGDS